MGFPVMTPSDQTAHGAVKVLREALLKQMEGQADDNTPSSIQRDKGLVWLEGWFDLEASLSPTTTDAVRGASAGPFKLRIKRCEDYSGEHREWVEEYTLPDYLVKEIQDATLHRSQSFCELCDTQPDCKQHGACLAFDPPRSPEAPIEGQDVERVATAIAHALDKEWDGEKELNHHDRLYNAARAAIAALRAPVERKGEG